MSDLEPDRDAHPRHDPRHPVLDRAGDRPGRHRARQAAARSGGPRFHGFPERHHPAHEILGIDIPESDYGSSIRSTAPSTTSRPQRAGAVMPRKRPGRIAALNRSNTINQGVPAWKCRCKSRFGTSRDRTPSRRRYASARQAGALLRRHHRLPRGRRRAAPASPEGKSLSGARDVSVPGTELVANREPDEHQA